MNERMRRRLLAVAPAIAIAILLLARRYQLELGHILSIAYLFWDYVLAAAILFLLVLALLSRPLRLAAFLAAVVVALDFVSPFLIDWSRNRGPATGPTLKVISFNWLAEDRDRSDIYAWLKQENPDILAIQEISGREDGVSNALYGLLPYHTQPVADVMILSRFPILKQANRMINANAMLRAELNVENRRLVVWAIHPYTLKGLDDVKVRDFYLAEVARYVSQETEPVLMMGDFNATRWDPRFAAIVAEGDLHEEPALLASPTRMAVRKGIPFFGSPIDHILTSTGNVLSDCHTGPNLGSDHKPLLCNLQLKR